MTIVHISGSLAGGGAEQMVLQLASRSNAEIDTRVFALANEAELEPLFKEKHINYEFLGINSFKNVTLWNGLKQLHHAIKNKKDIVFHCHQFHSVVLAMLYNLIYKSYPIVFTLHSSLVAELSRKIILFLTKPLRKKDIIFSPIAKIWYLKNSIIIPNGVDFDKYKMEQVRVLKSDKRFQFLFIGRLSYEKNPLILVDFALELIKKKEKNFVINILGIGVLYQNLIKIIEQNNLENYFILHGFKNNIRPYLEECHCLLIPSLWEGLPIALIESAAAKLPIISTAVGSIPDFLNNENAIVCDLDTFPDEMKKIINNYETALLKTHKLHDELFTIFNIKKVYDEHLNLYKSIV